MMNTIEILAVVFSVIIILKGLYILTLKKYPKKMDKFFKNTILIRIFYALVVLVLGYFVYTFFDTAKLAMTYLMGFALFFIMLFGFVMLLFADNWSKLAKIMFKKKWLLNIVMIFFMLAGAYTLYLVYFI